MRTARLLQHPRALGPGNLETSTILRPDRGAGLTFERGFTVTTTVVSRHLQWILWPDIAKKVLKERMTNLLPNVAPKLLSSVTYGTGLLPTSIPSPQSGRPIGSCRRVAALGCSQRILGIT